MPQLHGPVAGSRTRQPTRYRQRDRVAACSRLRRGGGFEGFDIPPPADRRRPAPTAGTPAAVELSLPHTPHRGSGQEPGPDRYLVPQAASFCACTRQLEGPMLMAWGMRWVRRCCLTAGSSETGPRDVPDTDTGDRRSGVRCVNRSQDQSISHPWSLSTRESIGCRHPEQVIRLAPRARRPCTRPVCRTRASTRGASRGVAKSYFGSRKAALVSFAPSGGTMHIMARPEGALTHKRRQGSSPGTVGP